MRLVPIITPAIAVLAIAASAGAGDILRGGTQIGAPKRTAIGGSASGSDSAARTQANARDRLSRTTQALNAMKALQAAARSAASTEPRTPTTRPPVVFDGLGHGGLQVATGVPRNLQKPAKGDRPSLWVGADLPTQTGSKKGGEVNVTIVQNEQQAILNWKTFNVGKKTTLTFDQSAGGANKGQWVAFNKVNDPSGRPSQILGSIKADGQVYVINQNGIIFGGSSQVNVHTLVASALPINDSLIARGLIDNPSAEFLFSAPRTETLSTLGSAKPAIEFANLIDEQSAPQITATLDENKSGSTTTRTIVLVAGKDYKITTAKDRRATLTLTTAGLAKTQGGVITATTYSASYVALNGDVVVQKGAQLTSPTSAAKVGGRIMLVGASVTNAGTLSTPDGQTILAAGLQVGIDAHKSSDPAIRGLDVYVGTVFDPLTQKAATAGTVTNAGLIDAPRANVNLSGARVDQLGVIDSSTTVSLNGSIVLNASYDAVSNPSYDPADATKGAIFNFRSTGAINLAAGSVTRILPELDSTESVIGSKLPLASQMTLRGKSIYLGKGATVLAPNAQITADAGNWYYLAPSGGGSPPNSQFVYTGGQIYSDTGALIDVSGTTGVEAPQSENILTLQFRGAELSNSPLQRTGPLRATDLTIDIRNRGTYNGRDWVGTPLADATGYANLIQHTVAELTTTGGSVSLHAGGSVVLQPGSGIDVSGGWVRYAGGFVDTSLVVTGGRVIDIAAATPDLVYDGLYTSQFVQAHSKWGISRTFKNPLALSGRRYEQSYIAGRDGGSISLTAPSMALDGSLAGKTTAGTRQLRNSQQKTELPAGSRLALSFQSQTPSILDPTSYLAASPHPPRIVFGKSSQAAADAFSVDALGEPLALRSDRKNLVVLSPDLINQEGFSALAVDDSAGRVTLPSDVSLNFQPGAPADSTVASLDLKALNITVRGSVFAPGGRLKFTTFDFSPFDLGLIASDDQSPDFHTPYADPRRGNFVLGAGATLSTAGLLVDDRPDTAMPLDQPIQQNGGSITINAFNASLARGSVLDVSGGATKNPAGKVTYGNAGSISLAAGQDPGLASLLGGHLVLGSTLKGYSGATGGSLSIQAPLIRIGAAASDRHTFAVSSGFFDQGGFASFSFAGLGSRPFRVDPFFSGGPLSPVDAFHSIPDNRALSGLIIEPGTTIAPVVTSLLAQSVNPDNEPFTLVPTVLPEALRSPVSLSFAARKVTDTFSKTLLFRGDLLIGAGATVAAGASGKVTVGADTVAVLGSLLAPGGAIKISGAAAFPDASGVTPFAARTTVYLGPDSVIDASGRPVFVPNDFGYRKGGVLPGGSIQISGNILADASSRLDVSGSSAMLDLDPAQVGLSAFAPVTSGLNAPLFSRVVVPTRVDSDGGTITLTGASQLFVDSQLLGAAGGPTALGGTLNVSSGQFLQANQLGSPKDITLVVTQSGSQVPTGFPGDGKPPIGSVVRDAAGRVIPGRGYFAVDHFTEGGFDSLTLGGVVRFQGPVEIAARQRLSVASGGFLYASDAVNLAAPYVQLGTAFLGPLAPLDPARTTAFTNGGQAFYTPPRYGTGSLTVHARLIDVGNLSLQNIGAARLIADGGDIRGDGTLEVAGHLTLQAGQIYPATSTSFTIAAYDYRLPLNPADKNSNSAGARKYHPGSVTILAGGSRPLPLSAGGDLNVYATDIVQAGTLRAPLGGINAGWDGSGAAPKSSLSGRAFATTDRLTLAGGSETSVSAADRGDGFPLYVPFGIVSNGTSWIDPSGVDITGGGVTAKDIRLGAKNLATDPGSTIDIRGGGNLYAYNWVSGQGGTEDILAGSGSFAVLPGYRTDYAPFAPFNTGTDSGALGGNPGYVNAGLAVGDRVYLGASDGLAAGSYTLLPARYALLPGAVLITPKSSAPVGTLALPDGSSLVSGYRYNALDTSGARSRVLTQFEVAPAGVVRSRAQYDDYFASSFLRKSARTLGAAIPRLPGDAGHLVFQAVDSLRLLGGVSALPSARGIGAYIDISSPGNILISGAANAPTRKNTLVLNADVLSGFGAESLLIGGVRNTDASGTTVDVTTRRLTVDNAGSPLTGPEIILVADQQLTLASGAEVIQSGTMGADAEALSIDGDGTLLRVSSDAQARITRTGVTGASNVKMTIGRGALISGTSLILDSSYATSLDPGAHLNADAVSLDSGRISLRLNGAGDLQPTDGLVLAGTALRGLRGVNFLSLLSYSSIDIYGHGSLSVDGSLELHAGEIRGFGSAKGRATLSAADILIDNQGHATRPGAVQTPAGSLALDAGTIRLGTGRIDVDQFASLDLNASDHLYLQGAGRLSAQGDITIKSPYIDAEESARERILASGNLLLQGGDATRNPAAPGLGASLDLQGRSVVANTDIYLPSGVLNLHAKTGDITVGGRLNVEGTEQAFYDQIKYTGAGRINLVADKGSVTVGQSGLISVAAQAGGGDAGTLAVYTPDGRFDLAGQLLGQGGRGGVGGSFLLDVKSLPAAEALGNALNAADFTASRQIRVRTGDVVLGGKILSHEFRLSADQGSITVDGLIDASGQRGGTIFLNAAGSLIVDAGARLTVAAKEFDAAGKGGSISLAAGSAVGGLIDPTALLDLRTGAQLDLGVAAQTSSSPQAGDFTGVLHLRAPQNASHTDLQMAAIGATIRNASSVEVEGYNLFDLTPANPLTTNVVITTSIQNSIKANGVAFLGAGGTTTAAYTAMHDRLLGGNTAAFDSIFTIRAGAEIINRTGDLTLGASNSDGFSNWNLQTYRFGPKSAPGVLTLRAQGDLVFNNALQDGFDIPNSKAGSAFTAPLMTPNALLPVNAQSWSFDLTAGADLGAADFRQVLAIGRLAIDRGSLLLGKNAALATGGSGNDGKTSSALGASGKFYQVIRTGSGDIEIAAGRDVRFRNQFASIYTAGTLISDPTMGGQFDLPILSDVGSDSNILGGPQQKYPVQYSLGGGNVRIAAQNDIYHLTRLNGATTDVEDSSRQLPINWLMRRGYVDPATGKFGTAKYGDLASTTWWVNFSNFFEGVGALGGGNVALLAGNDVRNIDAVAPTNARMPNGVPDAGRLLELGGGDVQVRAGHDISAGVYYAERGAITLAAGHDVTTNPTRSPSLTILTAEDPLPAATWLPTTLFLGKGSASVSALGDVLLGPVVNAFLLPGGFTNTFWNKTYFSTYAGDTAVNVSSLGGSLTLRQSATLPSDSGPLPILQTWLNNVMLLSPKNAAYYNPWIRLNESDVDSFGVAAALLPPILRATAFSGDVNLVGNLNIAPASRGTVDLAAHGAINGLQPNGIQTVVNPQLTTWSSSTINLSDVSPAAIPRIASPFAYQTLVGTVPSANQSGTKFLSFFDNLFAETGALDTVLQTKQTLHGKGLLHAGDASPVHLYALSGDVSGLMLFAGKAARVVAGNDITDISLYLQNNAASDISVVSAGRDIIAYDANSPLRTAAQSAGNILNAGDEPRAGDIQVGGAGSLEVLAGRNLDLGLGENNADGTGAGIVTIGNARNPYLPDQGAAIVTAAGILPSAGLASSALDFERFISEIVQGDAGDRYLSELPVDGDSKKAMTAADFVALSPDEQRRVALEIFYLALRDAGRDRNLVGSPGFGNYDGGFAAIASLFGTTKYRGDINTRSRDIRTKSGGAINVLAPGGKLTLSTAALDNQLAPPGIITETGGDVNVFARDNVDIGIGRIFTLRGGNMVIWSSTGDIAAGSASKTVASAPPTRVIIDPQSADVKTDLAGLATGGGIGVLATVAGVAPGDVDLIAPNGVIDAGDAGIRVSGNLNLAATAVLNASNISVAGTSAGAPSAAPPSSPNISGLTSAANTAGAGASSANSVANQARQRPTTEPAPSDISVEVIGYGGGDGDSASAATPGGGA